IHHFNELTHVWGDRGLDRGPVDVLFEAPDDGEVDLVLHVSNYDFPAQGGIVRDVQLGSGEAISSTAFLSKTVQLSVALILILHALYSIILYIMQQQVGRKLYFT